MTTTADLSKLVSYAVLNETGSDAAKIHSYAVLSATLAQIARDWPNPRGHQRVNPYGAAIRSQADVSKNLLLFPPPTPALTYWRFRPTVDDEFPDWIAPRRPAIGDTVAPTTPNAFWRFRPTVDDEFPDWLPRRPAVLGTPETPVLSQTSRRWLITIDDESPPWFPRRPVTPAVAFPVHFTLDKTIAPVTSSINLGVRVKFRLDQ